MRAPSVTTLAIVIGGLSLSAGLSGPTATAQALPKRQHSDLPRSLEREANVAMDSAAQWLIAQQHDDGHWSNPSYPALTALPMWALCTAGYTNHPAVKKAAEFLLSHRHDDGSIYVEPSANRKGGGLVNYNTALSIAALHMTGNPEYRDVVREGRQFLADLQHKGDDPYHGGMGYDAEHDRDYADLSNSYMAYEVMRLTENIPDTQAEDTQEADLDWEAAAEFIEEVQNNEPADAPKHRGGFAYTPKRSQAGSYTNENGEVRLRSYGSMTYAGYLSFIYADVDRDDPRVQAALDWAKENWTLERNPGMGQQGLYYYYKTMAKALAASGKDKLALPNGQTVQWRNKLITKLLNLKNTDTDVGGVYWKNPESRWMESDPTLVTSYMVLALDYVLNAGPTQ